MLEILPERPEEAAEIETLLDLVFGAERRRTKAVWRLRAGMPPMPELCFTARERGALWGALRFWRVEAGGRAVLLLGPLAVDPARRGRGVGARLMHHGLARAAGLGHGAVILVGDEGYYARFGFRRALARPLVLSGPLDARRLLAAELAPGGLAGVAGAICPARCLRGGMTALAA